MKSVLALFVAIAASAAAFASEPASRSGKLPIGEIGGTLIIAGGGQVHSILDSFIELAGGMQARIVLIPTASSRAERPELLTTYAYMQMKNVPVHILHTRDRKQANDPAFVEPLRQATGVWIGGGDQSLLVASYKNTLVEKELHRLLADGKVLGGTSAGAAVMSSVMILGGNPAAQIGAGFGFLERVVVDQHFQNRNRLARLLGVLGKHRDCLGVGIDEQTAIVVNGRTAKVVGDANVRVCVSPGSAKENVRVLQPGDEFDLLDVYTMMIGDTAAAAD
jgi:cyanophycinase